MEHDVVIGTIPLRESWPQPPQPASAPSLPAATGFNAPAPQPEPGVIPTAPPSYDESKKYFHLTLIELSG